MYPLKIFLDFHYLTEGMESFLIVYIHCIYSKSTLLSPFLSGLVGVGAGGVGGGGGGRVLSRVFER